MPVTDVTEVPSSLLIADSIPFRSIDVAIEHDPLQSPIYSRLDSTALHSIIDIRLESTPVGKVINEAKTSVFAALHDELPSSVEKIEKHPVALTNSGRHTHLTALQSVIQDTHRKNTAGQDGQINFDFLHQNHSRKHVKQLENAVDTVLAEEEDAIPAVL